MYVLLLLLLLALRPGQPKAEGRSRRKKEETNWQDHNTYHYAACFLISSYTLANISLLFFFRCALAFELPNRVSIYFHFQTHTSLLLYNLLKSTPNARGGGAGEASSSFFYHRTYTHRRMTRDIYFFIQVLSLLVLLSAN